MAVSRDNGAEIDLKGQDEFHQQGQRAKHKPQNPKEETLYKKISSSRSTAPGGCYVKFLDTSTFTQTYRLQNLSIQVKLDLESECEVEHTEFLRLDEKI